MEGASEQARQEIAQLEKILQEKRAVLEQQKTESGQEAPPEKEILHEVVREQIQQHSGSQGPVPGGQQSEPPSYLSDAMRAKVQDFVNIAFTRSLSEAIKAALETKNPAIIDAFHDVLVDQLYDELVARKQVEQPQ